MMIRKIGMAAGILLSALFSHAASAAYQLNLTTGATKLSQEVYDLHNLMMWIILVIFVGVFGVMFYSVYAHRKSVGHKADQFHENTTVELIWTIIPLFILVGMAYPATKALIELRDTSNPDLTIKVTGYQWKWGYDYLKGEGEGISFLSTLATPRDQIENKAPKGENYLLEVDNELVVPVGKKIRILTTAADVIHSWWVPSFGAKQDAIPGFIRDLWFRAEKTGTFRSQCVELCGKEHGFMPIVVEVVEQEKYDQWIAEKKKMTAANAAASGTMDGKAVYEKYCVACHGAGVAGAPKFGDKAAWAPRIAQGQDTLYTHALKGFKAMPPKGGATDLSDGTIKATVDYMVTAGK